MMFPREFITAVLVPAKEALEAELFTKEVLELAVPEAELLAKDRPEPIKRLELLLWLEA